MELRSRHWTLALTLAVMVHLGLAFFLLYESEEGAQAAGLGGIEVSLGPAGSSPGTADSAVESDISEINPVAAVETPVVEPELETVKAEVVDPVKPITEPIEEVRAQEVTPPPKPIPRPKPKLKPKPVVKPQPPTPSQTERQTQVAKAVSPASTATSGNAGKAGNQRQREAGSGNATPGGGLPGATADYFAYLRAWLEKHKRYPRRAQLRRQEGTVMLRFVMSREGRILSYRIERSSGHRLLDEEVQEMIERASPLPAMPPEMQQANLELVVPVSFFLR